MKCSLPRALAGVAVLAIVSPASVGPAEIVVEGDCTLVDAVSSANLDSAVGDCTAGSGDDEIVLTADVVLTESVDGTNGLPPIVSGITLLGNGFEISRDPGAPQFRVVAVPDSEFEGLVTLADVALDGGLLPSGDGGALWVSSRSAAVILTNVTLSGSNARRGGGLFIGLGGYGSYGQVEIDGSRIVDNQAYDGGGIFKAYGGYLDLTSSTVSGNTASGRGGGLSTYGGWYPFGQPGYSRVSTSTFSENSASYGGGINALGGLYMTNSTVSANYAAVAGGGLSTLTGRYEANSIDWSTITNNTTGSGLGGGLYNVTSGFVEEALQAESSIIAGNADTNCVLDLEIDTSGVNFDDDGTCGQDWSLMAGLDPELRDNGGSTLTHAVLDGSPAIDTSGPCSVSTDQRGFLRDDGSCDSGAYENGADALTLQGVCPGPIQIIANGATPNARMKIFRGLDPGQSEVPSGPCAGTDLGITVPAALGRFQTDAEGNGSITIELAEDSCGRFVQGITEPDCTTSKVAPIDDFCNFLSTSHGGQGSDPDVDPDQSDGCLPNRYIEGEILVLTASPSPGWGVSGWGGTDDDTSTEEINQLTMPATDHVVSVDYVQVCKPLTLSTTGQGTRPEANPANSAGCPDSQYVPGEFIEFFGADPQTGWEIGGWTGTDDDSSTDSTNTLTMPDVDFHVVTVDYVLAPTPMISLVGSCPGLIDVAIVNLTPNRTAKVYAGESGGTTVIPGGTCPGTELDLGFAQRWKVVNADGNGEATFSFTAAAAFCGRAVQAVDFDCTTSNVEQTP